METVDGRGVVVVGKLIEQLSGKRVCAGGIGHGCNRRDPHVYSVRRTYDDYSRNLIGVRLTDEQMERIYYCRRCGQFQGCHFCVGDAASLACINCRDWANDISEVVHGHILPTGKAPDAFKLVMMVAAGRVTPDDGEKLFRELIDLR